MQRTKAIKQPRYLRGMRPLHLSPRLRLFLRSKKREAAAQQLDRVVDGGEWVGA
jgi:hypothetical protein